MTRAGGFHIVLLIDAVPGNGPGAGGRERHMHAQVITFGLNGITEEQFQEVCGADAPTFANLPGLLAKIWLRDPETNTYGGLYLWDDQEAYEGYIKGEVFNAIKADQNLKNVESRDFGVFEDLSSLTMPKLRAV
jgi:heme-degrading monooxygenase HmoA